MNAIRARHQHIFRIVYALTAVAVLAAFTVIIALYMGQRAEDIARDRIAYYHLASSTVSEQLDRDTEVLKRLLDADTGAAPGRQSIHPAVNGILFSMRADLMQLSELHDLYAIVDFDATLARLIDGYDSIERLLANPERATSPIEEIAGFELAIEQLYRLHLVAAANSLADIEDRARHNLPTLVLLLGVVVTAVLVGWYLTRLLRRTLARQAAIEVTLAESQERMHHMQKLEALGQLVGGVAHDFNNLLTVIMGQTGLLQDRTAGDKRLQLGLDEISTAAQQAASLTKQLLAFGRRQAAEPQLFDLNGLIDNMQDLLRRTIGEDIELEYEHEDVLDSVKLDPGQMHQVIVNLVINARDAMPNGGKITLAIRNLQFGPDSARPGDLAEGQYVNLTVSDNGVGMDKETQDRVFEPFFTTKLRGRGTGLGLATVHGIVGAAFGHIEVDSRPGEGTRFDIYLPGLGRDLGSPAAESARERAEMPGGSETVLVVEDEAQILTLLCDGLTSLGYTVLTASGGVDGLKFCRKEPGTIDVIISDVVMPKMNGARFMKRALRLQPNAIGIYMSGYTDDVVLQQGVDGSLVPLIHKPFDLHKIAKVIRWHLNERAVKSESREAG